MSTKAIEVLLRAFGGGSSRSRLITYSADATPFRRHGPTLQGLPLGLTPGYVREE